MIPTYQHTTDRFWALFEAEKLLKWPPVFSAPKLGCAHSGKGKKGGEGGSVCTGRGLGALELQIEEKEQASQLRGHTIHGLDTTKTCQSHTGDESSGFALCKDHVYVPSH